MRYLDLRDVPTQVFWEASRLGGQRLRSCMGNVGKLHLGLIECIPCEGNPRNTRYRWLTSWRAPVEFTMGDIDDTLWALRDRFHEAAQ